jgi:hypothetical protein
VLTGDFIHNLRSALDHLVWQLALLRVAEPSTELQFPIHREAAEQFGDHRQSPTARVRTKPSRSSKLLSRIDRCVTESALAVVQALSNEDKHRLILETVSVPLEPSASEFDVETNADVAEDLEVVVAWGSTPPSRCRGHDDSLHAAQCESSHAYERAVGSRGRLRVGWPSGGRCARRSRRGVRTVRQFDRFFDQS